jgi:hypothetical protein
MTTREWGKNKQVGLLILYSILTMEEENMASRPKYKLLPLYIYIYILPHTCQMTFQGQVA